MKSTRNHMFIWVFKIRISFILYTQQKQQKKTWMIIILGYPLLWNHCLYLYDSCIWAHRFSKSKSAAAVGSCDELWVGTILDVDLLLDNVHVWFRQYWAYSSESITASEWPPPWLKCDHRTRRTKGNPKCVRYCVWLAGVCCVYKMCRASADQGCF